MSEIHTNTNNGNFGYQPNIEIRGYQPSKPLNEGYQPTSTTKTNPTPPSTGSPVQKPKQNK